VFFLAWEEYHKCVPCFVGTICFWGGRCSQNEGQGNTKYADHMTIGDNVGLTESFSISMELHDMPTGMYNFCF
jgi:hypothetical protein